MHPYNITKTFLWEGSVGNENNDPLDAVDLR